MSIIAIDIGTTTTKIIEYKDDTIINKEICLTKNPEKTLDEFIKSIKAQNIEQIVVTGIGAQKIKHNNYNIPIKIVDEFKAIATGGLYLSQKKQALIVSIGTGTAFIRASKTRYEHLGGTGIGAGTLTNLCNKLAGTNSFKDIIELSEKGTLDKIDIRIGDVTDKSISTLPLDLTLSNFGKFESNAKNADIVLGIINMIFETIGVMSAFALKNDKIKEVIVVGTITTIPCIKTILKKIEKLHKIKFIVPNNAEYACTIGAIKEGKV